MNGIDIGFDGMWLKETVREWTNHTDPKENGEKNARDEEDDDELAIDCFRLHVSLWV